MEKTGKAKQTGLKRSNDAAVPTSKGMRIKLKQLDTSATTPIEEAVTALRAAVRGDFTKRIRSSKTGELKDLFDRINETVKFMGNKMQSLNRCNIELKESIEDSRSKESSLRSDRILEEAIISSLGEGLIVVDRNRTITRINKQALKMFGYESDSRIVGEKYEKIIIWTNKSGKPVPSHGDPFEEVFSTGKKVAISISDDFYCIRRSGERFPVMISASPVIVEDNTKSVVAIFHDATKEKNIDEIKSDFISIASHQLRTPLTVSSLHAEMLLAGGSGPLNTEQRRYLEEIQSYNKKMAQLLNDFLVVSKIELGTFAVESKPADIPNILEDVLHEVENQVRKKSIKLERFYAKDLPLAETDSTLVRIVFQNLVTNAVKYTPEGGTVQIRVDADKRSVLIEIEDSGYGIPPDEQRRIFSKLFRGSNAKKHDSDGTGLGLYIAKSIIDKCRGKISFESPSASGEGTTFFISIPRVKNKA